MQHFATHLHRALTVVNAISVPSMPSAMRKNPPDDLQDLISSSRYLDQGIFDNTPLQYVCHGRFCIYSYGVLSPKIWVFICKACHLLDELFGAKISPFVHIALAFSKKKKLLPTRHGTIGPESVNSGVSMMRCSCCVIYRQEEMQKVILHELMHLWGVDAKHNEHKDKIIQDHLNIRSLHTTIRLGETYNDTICCLIITAMRAFKAAGHFHSQFALELERTRRHILIKAANMAEFYRGREWTEATHAFSYYVAKAVLFQHLDKFDHWLAKQPNTGANADFYSFILPLLLETLTPFNLAKHFQKYMDSSKSIRMMPVANKS